MDHKFSHLLDFSSDIIFKHFLHALKGQALLSLANSSWRAGLGFFLGFASAKKAVSLLRKEQLKLNNFTPREQTLEELIAEKERVEDLIAKAAVEAGT